MNVVIVCLTILKVLSFTCCLKSNMFLNIIVGWLWIIDKDHQIDLTFPYPSLHLVWGLVPPWGKPPFLATMYLGVLRSLRAYFFSWFPLFCLIAHLKSILLICGSSTSILQVPFMLEFTNIVVTYELTCWHVPLPH